MKKKQKKVVKAWTILNLVGGLTNKQTEHFQIYSFKERKPAEYLAWLWNTQKGNKTYKVVPCTITYSN